MMPIEQRLIINSLLPQEVIFSCGYEAGQSNQLSQVNAYLPRHNFERRLEQSMTSVALLVTNTVLGAIKAFQNNDFVKLDANPGDSGCQNRALILRELVEDRASLDKECELLSRNVEPIRKNILQRKQELSKQREESATAVFFQQQLGALTVSKDLEYIILCYLSNVLMESSNIRPDGIVKEKTNISRLDLLSKGIFKIDRDLCKKIVDENQVKLSQLSVERMHTIAGLCAAPQKLDS
jgi:hypothetical protein